MPHGACYIYAVHLFDDLCLQQGMSVDHSFYLLVILNGTSSFGTLIPRVFSGGAGALNSHLSLVLSMEFSSSAGGIC